MPILTSHLVFDICFATFLILGKSIILKGMYNA